MLCCQTSKRARHSFAIAHKLHELDPIPKRVGDVYTMVAFQRLISNHRKARLLTALYECFQARDEQCGMSFLRRPKVVVYPEMDFQRALPEPHAPALCQVGGLRRFRQSQTLAVKGACLLFLVRR